MAECNSEPLLMRTLAEYTLIIGCVCIQILNDQNGVDRVCERRGEK